MVDAADAPDARALERASMLLRTDRTEEALGQFRELLQRDPENLGARRGVARSLLRLDAFGEARAHFVEILARWPDDVEGLVGLGTCALRSGDLEAAVSALGRAQRIRPGHVGSALKLAEVLTRLERSSEALDMLRGSRREHPESTSLCVALASLHADRGEPDLAVDELTVLAGLPPGGWWESVTAARTWIRVGRCERAVPILERIREGSDARRRAAVEVLLFDALLGLERWEEALAVTERRAPEGLRTVSWGSEATPPRPVPALIHQYWEPGDLPEEYRSRAEEWRQRNPDLTYRLWGPEDAEGLLSNLSDGALRAFRSLAHPAMRADVFRYGVLQRFGGVYLDADLVASVPLRLTVLRRPGFHVTVASGQAGRPLDVIRVKNDFIAAPPEHPILGLALSTAVDNVLSRSGGSLYRLAGPPVLSRAFASVLRDRAMDAGCLHVWEADRERGLRLHRARSAEQAASHWTRLPFEAGFVPGPVA